MDYIINWLLNNLLGISDGIMVFGLLGVVFSAQIDNFWIGVLIFAVSFSLFAFGLDITIHERVEDRITELRKEIGDNHH